MISPWPTCNLACIPDGSTKRQKAFCSTHPKGTLRGDFNRKLSYLSLHSRQEKGEKTAGLINIHVIHEAVLRWGWGVGGGGSQHDWTIKAFIAGNYARKPNNLALNYFSADLLALLIYCKLTALLLDLIYIPVWVKHIYHCTYSMFTYCTTESQILGKKPICIFGWSKTLILIGNCGNQNHQIMGNENLI